jgi:mono/diheme cytochrome c family protein
MLSGSRPCRRFCSRWSCFLVVAVVLASSPTPALAANEANGAQLARLWCASCHLMPGSGQQAVPQGPPSFRGIAQSGRSPDQLRTFLAQPHGSMPNLTLSRSEIDDLIAYIMTLR